MDNLAPLPWATTRLAALILLALYAVLAAVLYNRELRFLAGLPRRDRLQFYVQAVLIQLAVLASLLPAALSAAPTRRTLLTCLAGLAVLWVAVIWTAIARSMYTYRIMLDLREDGRRSGETLEAAASPRPPSGPAGRDE